MQEHGKAACGSLYLPQDFLLSHCKEGPKAISEHPEAGSTLPWHTWDPSHGLVQSSLFRLRRETRRWTGESSWGP